MVTRPAWAEISIDSLLHNYNFLRIAAGDAGLIAVVKANAYGHGALLCAKVLSAAGVQWLGVTNVEEAIAVRAICSQARILVMSGIWIADVDAAIEHQLTPVVWELAHLQWLEAAAVRLELAAGSLPVHLEIDTGMARQGVRLEELPAFLDRLAAARSLRLEGVMTHFHSPELLESSASADQMERFEATLALIQSRGYKPSLIHSGNSATLLRGTKAFVELAARYGATALLRPGLALYGYAPRFSSSKEIPVLDNLKPVLSWKAAVISLRSIEAGESAGYCATFQAARKTRLALLRVGYADGLNRLLSNRGEVLVRGQRAPIVGRVSMDLTIVDVTDVAGVALGDEVVLIGEQGNAQSSELRTQQEGSQALSRITAYDHADWAGTIPYETLCAIGARVPRIAVGAGYDHAQ